MLTAEEVASVEIERITARQQVLAEHGAYAQNSRRSGSSNTDTASRQQRRERGVAHLGKARRYREAPAQCNVPLPKTPENYPRGVVE